MDSAALAAAEIQMLLNEAGIFKQPLLFLLRKRQRVARKPLKCQRLRTAQSVTAQAVQRAQALKPVRSAAAAVILPFSKAPDFSKSAQQGRAQPVTVRAKLSTSRVQNVPAEARYAEKQRLTSTFLPVLTTIRLLRQGAWAMPV